VEAVEDRPDPPAVMPQELVHKREAAEKICGISSVRL
jgi:hypothetical protein